MQNMQKVTTVGASASPAPSVAIPAPPLGALTERIALLNGDVILTIQYAGEQRPEVFEMIEEYGKMRKDMLAKFSKKATDQNNT